MQSDVTSPTKAKGLTFLLLIYNGISSQFQWEKKDESSLWMQLDSEHLQQDNMSLQRANHGKVRPISHRYIVFRD